MVFNLKMLVEDAEKKLLKASGTEAPAGHFKQVWETIDHAITDSVVNKKQSTHVPCLGTFCVHLDMSLSFQPAKAFVRKYGLNMVGAPAKPQPNKIKKERTINFTEAAMKFSKKGNVMLSKTEVFDGHTHLMRCLGQAISAQNDTIVEAEFTVGKLRVVSGVPEFNFAQVAVEAVGGLSTKAVTQAASVEPPKPSPNTFNNLSMSGLNISGSATARSGSGGTARMTNRSGSQVDEDAALDTGRVIDMAGSNTSRSSARARAYQEQELYARNLNDDLSARSSQQDEVEPPPGLTRADLAAQEAMGRYLNYLEVRAENACKERADWEKHLVDCTNQEKFEMDQRYQMESNNEAFVRMQISENAKNALVQREFDILERSAHEFPTFQEGDAIQQAARKAEIQQEIRSTLTHQLNTKAQIGAAQKRLDDELAAAAAKQARQDKERIEKKEAAMKRAAEKQNRMNWNLQMKQRQLEEAIENHGNSVLAPHMVAEVDLGVALSNGGKKAFKGHKTPRSSRTSSLAKHASL